MSEMTLLEMVQRISEFINGETITSIHDTREAEQIATIIKETYEDLLLSKDIKAKKNIFHVESLSDTSKPTYFRVQSPIALIEFIRYKDTVNNLYKTLRYVETENFICDSLDLLGTSQSYDEITDFSGRKLYVRNDKMPESFTILNSNYIICDSYDKTVEVTLQQTNIFAEGVVFPEWTSEDTFVPNLAVQHFPLLLSKAKLNADMELRSRFNQLEGERAARQSNLTNLLATRDIEEMPKLWRNRMMTGRR